MTDAATFWDKIAPKYAKDPISDVASYEYTLGRTLSYLTEDDSVFELGCGTGSTALHFAPHVRDIVGTGLSSGMIDIAKTRAAQIRVTNTDFRRLSAEDAAKLKDPITAVLAHNLFHLVCSAEDIFADIHRMLPPGGIFVSKTGCLSDKSFGFKRFPIKIALPLMRLLGKAPYVRFFTSCELEDALIFAGFDIIASGSFPSTSRYIVAKRV